MSHRLLQISLPNTPKSSHSKNLIHPRSAISTSRSFADFEELKNIRQMNKKYFDSL